MASISSLGAGSGLDLEGIVTKLMAVEQLPITALKSKESSFNARLSAYGSIKSSLATLQTATQALAGSLTFNSATTSVADPAILSATSTSGAKPGNYRIDVEQLAQAQTLRSNTPFANTTDTFNTGTVAISVGGAAAINVTIDSSNNTPAGIRDAVNAADAGVTATIVNDGATNRLIFSSDTTGLTAGAVSIAVSDSGSGGANALATLDGSNLVELLAPKDAQFSVNGLTITRASNTVSDVISGVTLNLTKAGTIGAPVTTQLGVTRDTDAIQKAITTFVDSYNAVVNQLKSLSAYDAASKTGAVLNGDSSIRTIRGQLSKIITGSVGGLAGGISRLSDIGINLQQDGTLLADTTKLSGAIASNSKSVAGLFGSTASGNQGFAVLFNSAIDGFVNATGLIASRTDSINSSIKATNKQIDALTTRLTQVEANYRKRFAALDTILASMQQTQSYLTQQLSYLQQLATGAKSNA